MDNAKREVKEGGMVVKEFDSKMSRVPWLERTGFVLHLAGLRDAEIKSSYQLPNRKGDGEGQLLRICEAAELVLRDAYKLCSDMSPDRKMTQQRANILTLVSPPSTHSKDLQMIESRHEGHSREF